MKFFQSAAPCGLAFWKGEQLVAIVCVLLPAGGDLGGESLREVVTERVEAIEDGDDFLLNFKRRDRNIQLL